MRDKCRFAAPSLAGRFLGLASRAPYSRQAVPRSPSNRCPRSKRPEGYNHFEIPETLANPYGLLGRAVLAQMNLSHG